MKNEKTKRIIIIAMALVIVTALGSFALGTGHTSLPEAEAPSESEEIINEPEEKETVKQETKKNSDEKELSPASENVLGNVSKKDKRLAELTDKYNDKMYGTVAYYLEVAQKYSLPICFIGIAMGAFNFLIIGNKKLDKKEQGFGWIVGFTIGLVVFNVIPLLFALFVAAR